LDAVVNARLVSAIERMRGSLFLVPMLYVAGGVALGQVGIVVDDRLAGAWDDLPIGYASTVASARAVLSTVAGATITVAGIAFSISLLIFQLASSQYSPRVVHGLFRDPFNKQVIGVVLGTFTYCLVVLRAVRGPLDDGGDAVVPNLSVGLAVVLGIGAIGAIVAFINHSAHSMEVSSILERTASEALRRIDDTWPARMAPETAHGSPGPSDGAEASVDGERRPPGSAGYRVVFHHDGWIRDIDVQSIVEAMPAGSIMRCETAVGRYAVRGTTLCTFWGDVGDIEAFADAVRAAVRTGDTRVLENDVSYGLRQLVDVAVRALSPGVNDPTTAQDAIFHSATVLNELLQREPPAREVHGSQGRTLLMPQRLTHRELIDLTVDEVRRAAAPHPTVCIYLIEMLSQLLQSLPADDGRTQALRRQAALVVQGAAAEEVLGTDLARIRDIHARHFGAPLRIPTPSAHS
jgi:uncharacterized membrane protein